MYQWTHFFLICWKSINRSANLLMVKALHTLTTLLEQLSWSVNYMTIITNIPAGQFGCELTHIVINIYDFSFPLCINDCIEYIFVLLCSIIFFFCNMYPTKSIADMFLSLNHSVNDEPISSLNDI